MAEPPLFIVRVRGAQKVKALLDRAVLGTTLSLSKKGLQRLLVDRTKARLDPLGAAGVGVQQKDPDGKYWPELDEATKKYHKNPNRMLYRDGDLQKSITATRSQLKASQLQSPTGGGFVIGIRSGSRAEKYARHHQFGTEDMQQRRFLGVGRPDVIAVDNMIQRNFAKAGIRYG